MEESSEPPVDLVDLAPTRDPPTFMTLPQEIRDQIIAKYATNISMKLRCFQGRAIDETEARLIFTEDSLSRYPGLLLACHQTRTEVIEAICQQHPLEFPIDEYRQGPRFSVNRIQTSIMGPVICERVDRLKITRSPCKFPNRGLDNVREHLSLAIARLPKLCSVEIQDFSVANDLSIGYYRLYLAGPPADCTNADKCLNVLKC